MRIPKLNPNFEKIFKYTYTAFVGLGAYRGVKSYNHEYKTNMVVHNARVKAYGTHWNSDEPKYFYGGCALRCVLGIFLYGSPWGVGMFAKEIYRLEVNLRGIESEKKSNFYNYLLFGQ
jgi:hypothetical protein